MSNINSLGLSYLRAFLLFALFGSSLISGSWLHLNAAPLPQTEGFDCGTVSEISVAECQALVSLYNSTNGANWNNQEDWLETATPCSWNGVACIGGGIIRIMLPDNGLNGEIPPEIGGLINLRWLILHDNQLNGAIPSEISSLARLETLRLDANQLTGNIPVTFRDLPAITAIELQRNRLEGAIPAELGELTQLTFLRLDQNRLSGQIPAELGDIETLQILDLSFNQLSGFIPTTFTQLENLSELTLGFNLLRATDEALLALLNRLTPTWAQTQTIPPSDFQATAGVRDVQLTWTPIPYTLEGGYYEIWLSTTAGGPYERHGSTASKESSTYIAANLLPDVTYYFIVRTFTPANAFQQSNLLSEPTFELSATTLPNRPSATEENALRALYNHTQGFNWSNNSGWMSNASPCDWYGVICDEQPAVVRLDLYNNRLDGILPTELGALSQLTTLYLHDNYLHGSIPKQIGNLQNLQLLWLSNNRLSGSIPTTIGNLSLLTDLRIAINQLSGSIPGEIGNLNSLMSLVLSDNQLSGLLPAELGNLSNIREISLFNNRLAGAIPSAIRQLTQVEIFDIQYNGLYATDPSISDFLNAKVPGWDETQTIAPTELSAVAESNGRVVLTWEPIKYVGNDGYYEIRHSTVPGGPYATLGTTEAKSDRTFTAEGLLSNAVYYFVLRAYTPASQYQDNELWSEDSQEISVTTLGEGTTTQEADTLRRIYNSLNGVTWQNSEGWGTIQSYCTWYGVLCDETGSVVGLELGGNQLGGALPAELGQLPNLTYIEMQNNQIGGSIPAELANLSGLSTLLLQNNQLSGGIPTNLANLSQLSTLDLNYNKLTASDSTLLSFLNDRNSAWIETQTVAPTLLQATVQLDNQIQLIWEPIPYTEDGGYYEVHYSTNNNGPYTLHGTTQNKASVTYTITDFLADTSYYLVVRSYTPAHSNQSNALWSNYSNEVSVQTGGTPLVGDIYELDNQCVQAQLIAATGSIQSRTFYTYEGADSDWVRVSVNQGTTYAIEVRVPSSSQADVVLELYDSCNGNLIESQNPEFSPDIRLTFSPLNTGNYYLHLRHVDDTDEGTVGNYHLSIRPLSEDHTPGAAIIVGGRYLGDEALQDNIHHVTNKVYATWQASGYERDQLYYMAVDASLDADGDGQADVNAISSQQALQMAITQWAVDKVSSDRPLTLYLVGDGARDQFYLDRVASEVLNPQSLNRWLDELESAVPNLPINIIVEARSAGSFIDLDHTVSKPGRVVIAATSPDALAWPSWTGAIFSDIFLDSLNQGRSFYAAFEEAGWATQQTYAQQIPWIDYNGDGFPDVNGAVSSATQGAGSVAALRSLTSAELFEADAWAPHITQATINDLDNGMFEIRAEVLDNEQAVKTVQALIYPPSYLPPTGTNSLVLSPQPIDLQYQGSNTYSILYPEFRQDGEYLVILYAIDNQGLRSRLKEIRFGVELLNLYLPVIGN